MLHMAILDANLTIYLYGAGMDMRAQYVAPAFGFQKNFPCPLRAYH